MSLKIIVPYFKRFFKTKKEKVRKKQQIVRSQKQKMHILRIKSCIKFKIRLTF